LVGSIGLGEGLFRIHVQERMQGRVKPRNLIQRGANEVAAGEFAARQSALHLGEGEGGDGWHGKKPCSDEFIRP